jgi:hypothetical protein
LDEPQLQVVAQGSAEKRGRNTASVLKRKRVDAFESTHPNER